MCKELASNAGVKGRIDHWWLCEKTGHCVETGNCPVHGTRDCVVRYTNNNHLVERLTGLVRLEFDRI